jgi:hypothetical protein
LEGETTIFRGKSPSGTDLPTGVRLHPLGNRIRGAMLSDWANPVFNRNKKMKTLNNNFIRMSRLVMRFANLSDTERTRRYVVLTN